jgi:carbamoyltransferase
MSYIIGISAYYHDSSACLLKDGELLFACEEEKFTGLKHDCSFPVKTIEYIFKKYNLSKKDIEAVCYYEDLDLKTQRVINNAKKVFFKAPIYAITNVYNVLKNKKDVKNNLAKISDKVFYSKHHDSHTYYSFYTSPFNDAVVLSVDGVGENETIQIATIYNNKLYQIPHTEYPNSLGLFYSAMTAFLGFKPNEGEYKVMGLASYGNPKKYRQKVDSLISYKQGFLTCNMDCFIWDRSNKVMFNHNLSKKLGIENRLPDEKLTVQHHDLAAAVQETYEVILSKILEEISILANTRNLCLSGGCAYNGSANGKLTNNGWFKNLWIPPAPSDAGSAIGACLNYLDTNNKLTKKIDTTPFLGPEYTNEEYLSVIDEERVIYSEIDRKKLLKLIATEIYNGKVVGWFQGKIEFGSRALGNRSILANPMIIGMQKKINRVIKKRELFRPFAPMVTKENQTKYFLYDKDVPYMNQVVKVKKEYIGKLVATTHVDDTARIQTVTNENNVYDLLIEFEKISGVSVLLNTSFNVKDKTMVLTPQDAMDTFLDTEMDILVLGDNVIYKKTI